jgi:TolB protein
MPEQLQSPVRLTTSYQVKQHLRFTPDGTHLVFAETRGAYITLQVVKVDGTGQRPLFEGRTDFIQQHPAWSPDGKQLAFTVSDGQRTGRIGISLCDCAGLTFSNFRPLLMGGQFSYPTWSAQVKQLALITNNLHLMVADLDGKKRGLIGPPEGIQAQPNWSPDGKQIAFSSSHLGHFDIYTIRPDGSGLTRLTKDAGMNYRPVYSPDGKWLAFSSNREGSANIHRMRPDGSALQNLTRQPALNDHAAWSPDSREMAFISTRDGGQEIYRLRLQ